MRRIISITSMAMIYIVGLPILATAQDLNKNGGFLQSEYRECERCSNMPETAKELTFEQARETFSQASPPSTNDLVGTWIWTMQVDDPSVSEEFKVEHWESTSDEKQSAFKNIDGSEPKLEFYRGAPSAFATVHQARVEYKWQNDGMRSLTAGPYSAVFRDGSVCMAHKERVYDIDPNNNLLETRAYTNLREAETRGEKYECRVIGVNHRLMICAVTLVGNLQEYNYDAAKPFVGKQVIFNGFRKIK